MRKTLDIIGHLHAGTCAHIFIQVQCAHTYILYMQVYTHIFNVFQPILVGILISAQTI